MYPRIGRTQYTWLKHCLYCRNWMITEKSSLQQRHCIILDCCHFQKWSRHLAPSSGLTTYFLQLVPLPNNSFVWGGEHFWGVGPSYLQLPIMPTAPNHTEAPLTKIISMWQLGNCCLTAVTSCLMAVMDSIFLIALSNTDMVEGTHNPLLQISQSFGQFLPKLLHPVNLIL